MQFIHPLEDHIVTRDFYYKAATYAGGQHAALDLIRKTGTTRDSPVRAVAAGTVAYAGHSDINGNFIGVVHADGFQSWYRHLIRRAPVVAGQSVAQGQNIGHVGNTGWSQGDHLHFDLWCTTKHDNGAFAKHGLWAHDPELYLGKEDDDMALTGEEHAMLQTIHHFAKISGPAMQAAILVQARAAHAHAKAANAKCKAIETKINNLVAGASGGHSH